MNLYKELAKKFLAGYAGKLRKQRGRTQDAMAEQLHITSRAYGDLERGKFCFSSVVLLFMLCMLSNDEVAAFLDDFRQTVSRPDQKEVA